MGASMCTNFNHIYINLHIKIWLYMYTYHNNIIYIILYQPMAYYGFTMSYFLTTGNEDNTVVTISPTCTETITIPQDLQDPNIIISLYLQEVYIYTVTLIDYRHYKLVLITLVILLVPV